MAAAASDVTPRSHSPLPPHIRRYEEPLAAEAMRAHENNEEAALGVLSSPAGYEALQEALLAKSSELSLIHI